MKLREDGMHNATPESPESNDSMGNDSQQIDSTQLSDLAQSSDYSLHWRPINWLTLTATGDDQPKTV